MKGAFAISAIWLGLCASVQAADNVDSGKILALENAWNQAQLHHDANALSQLLPATFVYTDYDGTVEDKDGDEGKNLLMLNLDVRRHPR